MPYPVRVVRDLLFAAPGGVPLHADLFLPQETHRAPPVILWVHAGGWRFGSRHLAPDLSRFFAERGFAMAAIDYRLTRHATFPAQLEDVRTAIAWLRGHADEYAIDAGRIGLWGSSAGAHLSALVALTACGAPVETDGWKAASQAGVLAVVAGYPPVDFLQLDRHRPPPGTVSADPETLLLPRYDMRSADPDSFESLLLGAPIETCPERVHAANPLTYVRDGAPPFLILHGLADTTISAHQSVLLYDALVAHRNDATLCLVEGLGHGFLHRTHLDEAPRRMTVRRRNAEGRDTTETVTQPIFPLIERFFATHLVSDPPRI
jgi:acetyl esterase/lipase